MIVAKMKEAVLTDAPETGAPETDAAGADAAATEALYHRAILDFARSADGAGRLESPSASALIDNPLCGDRVTVEVALAGETVTALAHRVRGCVLCQAAAGVLGRHAPGRSRTELRQAGPALAAMLREGGAVPAGWPELAMFLPVRPTRGRHDCVLLPFQALEQALRAAPADAAGGSDRLATVPDMPAP